jgi:coproporphyrinogen III oxidase-like Fe-S oxidoreductase
VVFRNHVKQATYLARIDAGQSPVESIRVLDDGEQRLRYVTLTLGDGQLLDRVAYRESFASDVDQDFAEPIRRLVGAGLVRDDGRRLGLTDRGGLVYDLVTRAFYPDRIRRWMHDRQSASARAAGGARRATQ